MLFYFIISIAIFQLNNTIMKQNSFFFYALRTKESHMGVEQHKSEQMMTELQLFLPPTIPLSKVRLNLRLPRLFQTHLYTHFTKVLVIFNFPLLRKSRHLSATSVGVK